MKKLLRSLHELSEEKVRVGDKFVSKSGKKHVEVVDIDSDGVLLNYGDFSASVLMKELKRDFKRVD